MNYLKPLILIINLGIINISYSQTYNIQSSIDSIFSELDTEYLSTNILIDKAIVFSRISEFDGSTDSVINLNEYNYYFELLRTN